MSFTREEFLKLTVDGYPLPLNESKLNEFFKLFALFVNESKNDFFAESTEFDATIHSGMRTEVCSIYYENAKVKITSPINENDFSSVGEFTSSEEHFILGHACVGILTFCDLFEKNLSKNKKSVLDNNKKYKAWPV